MSLNATQKFFYNAAGHSWTPGRETKRQGHEKGARRLASAEDFSIKNGYSFHWQHDTICDSSDFSDDIEPWQLWQVTMYDAAGQIVESLGGIDFGRDGQPWGQSYRRVVEAELALEVLPK